MVAEEEPFTYTDGARWYDDDDDDACITMLFWNLGTNLILK